jgi:hypothetical protein
MVEVTRVAAAGPSARHCAGDRTASSVAIAQPVANLMLRSLNGSRFARRLRLSSSYPLGAHLFTRAELYPGPSSMR